MIPVSTRRSFTDLIANQKKLFAHKKRCAAKYDTPNKINQFGMLFDRRSIIETDVRVLGRKLVTRFRIDLAAKWPRANI